ncbi:GIY-YIG nuclease family protein [Fusibacter ferrireducens]|uniref:GIY-YIG nuclease family protein n=1 Tax=Fusibacter ferrireducens TaxID=2785058 RepID=A0ABR9ZPV7_9FIRM|nr:GIY-YIG nuclease family protein [Fusibacter ferrireducens]MBF4692163.1 GIY-YIG nuclease family protein [Fusibacter ferrireducens]
MVKMKSKKELKDNYKNHEIMGGVYCIECSGNGKFWLRSAQEIKTAKNRFLFSKSTNASPEMCMQKEWKQYGPDAFTFKVLEEIKKGELQTAREFKEDLNVLLELWKIKLDSL